jgi:hypothetical protein
MAVIRRICSRLVRLFRRFFSTKALLGQKIGINSEIPVDDESQDMIYTIEVLEHVPRPYDFFLEAGKKRRIQAANAIGGGGSKMS